MLAIIVRTPYKMAAKGFNVSVKLFGPGWDCILSVGHYNISSLFKMPSCRSQRENTRAKKSVITIRTVILVVLMTCLMRLRGTVLCKLAMAKTKRLATKQMMPPAQAVSLIYTFVYYN